MNVFNLPTAFACVAFAAIDLAIKRQRHVSKSEENRANPKSQLKGNETKVSIKPTAKQDTKGAMVFFLFKLEDQ